MNEEFRAIIISIFALTLIHTQSALSQYGTITMEFINEGYYNSTIIYSNGTLNP
jgi:hypothetical protein